MPKLTGSRRRFRLMTAYGVTLRVLLSFGGFFLLAKLLGPQWQEARSDTVYLRNARRIKTAILNLKGLFIKVGQLISIMSNFVPAAFREELEELQDRIPPRPYEEIAQRIEEDERELSRLAFQQAIAGLENPLILRTLRREVARLKTILNQKEAEAAEA